MLARENITRKQQHWTDESMTKIESMTGASHAVAVTIVVTGLAPVMLLALWTAINTYSSSLNTTPTSAVLAASSEYFYILFVTY